MKKYAICFLTVSPCESFYHFCKMLNDSEYTVYFCVDNNEYQIPHFQKEDIKIIKVDREVCEKEGFHSTVAYFPDGYACSRDKALYYFCRIEPNVYDKIWFIEEDVFIPSLNALKNIDDKYPLADLLSSAHRIKNDKTFVWNNSWHWKRIFKQMPLPPPYATSMICAIRLSSKMLKVINAYATKIKSLCIDEVFFNTLALKTGLLVAVPLELHTIQYRTLWKNEEIQGNKNNLFHPIKNIERQNYLRKQIQKQIQQQQQQQQQYIRNIK